MIRFVDIKTGNVFNGDKPYIFWFDKEQSTNIIYTKTLCFITDKREVECGIECSGIFSLIDSTKFEAEKIVVKQRQYTDISSIQCTTLRSCGTKYEDEELYVHILYIAGFSSKAGEYIGTFTIDGETFNIGADFYDENEILGINLANIGFEIPSSVQGAIYETNVHEESADNITLNRKYKELLLQHMDIIGSKGSYKSLIQSLKWFEYGDLVQMNEYWKYTNMDREMFYRNDIEQFVTSKIQQMLTSFQKTTYIGLYLALQHIVKNGESIQYNTNSLKGSNYLPEPVPTLKHIVSKWGDIDLSLKMTLLGNFFSTYFMPIHLDLIHSTVESIVFSDLTKVVNWGHITRMDFLDSIESFDCNVGNGDTYYLSNVKAYVNPHTLFRDTILDDVNEYKEYIHIFGVDLAPGEIKSDFDTKVYSSQLFDGIGTIIPFECGLKHIENGCIISEGNILLKKDDEPYELYDTIETTNVNVDDNECVIKFNVLLQEIGNYRFVIRFHCNNGHDYFRTIVIRVDDDVYQSVKMYKIVKKSPEEYINKFESHDYFAELNSIENAKNRLDILYTSDDPETFPTYLEIMHALCNKDEGSCFADRDTKNQFLYEIFDVEKRYTKEEIYALLEKYITPSDTQIPFDINDYMYTMNVDNDNKLIFKQFLAANDTALYNTLSTNKVLYYVPQMILDTDDYMCFDYFFEVQNSINNYKFRTTYNPLNDDDFNALDIAYEPAVTIEGQPSLTPQNVLSSFIWLSPKRFDYQLYKYIYESNPTNPPLSDLTENKDILDFYNKLSEDDPYWKLSCVPHILGIDRTPNHERNVLVFDKKNIGIIKNGRKTMASIKMFYDTQDKTISFRCSDRKRVEIRYKDRQEKWVTIFDFDNGEKSRHIFFIDDKVYLRIKQNNDTYSYFTVDLSQHFTKPSSNYRYPLSSNILYATNYDENNQKIGSLWYRDVFVPLFYKLEEVNDNAIKQDEVVCFFPDLTKIKGQTIADLGWKIINRTTGQIIEPRTIEPSSKFIPVQPLYGRYDYRLIPDKGYYDIELRYELTDKHNNKHIYKANSSFVVL